MRSHRLLAMAAILFSSVAVPASAAWDRIGSVDFSARDNGDTQYGNFGGRVESLSLIARDADVRVRETHTVFPSVASCSAGAMSSLRCRTAD